MLAADKNALARELRLNMLQLQWKELDYLHKNFVNLTVTSSVLVGFGVASFQISQTYKPTGKDNDDYLSIWELDEFHWGSWYFLFQLISEALFVACAALGLAWNILCLFISTLSVMCGPGMALRGQEGSVAIAVRHSESMLKRALRFFGRGITAFTLSMVTIGLRQGRVPADLFFPTDPACDPHADAQHRLHWRYYLHMYRDLVRFLSLELWQRHCRKVLCISRACCAWHLRAQHQRCVAVLPSLDWLSCTHHHHPDM